MFCKHSVKGALYFFIWFFYFYKDLMFFSFIIMFFFLFLMNNLCWSGSFFMFDSYMFILMVILSFFILMIVLMTEKNKVLLVLSKILVLVCVMFFFSGNLLSLYIFFEISMFPIIMMILSFGSQIEKINSSYYLMFYASFCSFPFLFVFFYYQLDFHFVYFLKFLSWELVFLLTLGFMMKFPVYFLHLWLPKAHVEAPTTASMLLAGLLLKLGTVGFYRILKVLSVVHMNFWFFISFLGMIMSSFNCAFQSDSKSLAAYSSVTHMGFTLLCLILFSLESKISSLMMMVAHGFTSTLMFFFIGEYYHQSGSRMMYFLNSFLNISLFLTILFTFTFLSNSGVPPSMSFFSEFLTILVLLNYNNWMILILGFFFFFAFYYSIYFITNFFQGKSFVFMSNLPGFNSLFFVFLMFNVFWISIFIWWLIFKFHLF